ncbi:MAG: MATE family efflux transporter [Geminicoccaceae bacterium]|nr:MATE family efflux transporter [Geminicoccaceae bacterium]
MSSRLALPLKAPARPFARELRAMVAIAAPLALAQVGILAINTTDVLMLGRLGPKALAATALALSIFHPLLLFGIGIVTATAPLSAAAWGRRDLRGLRRVVRQGLWAAVPFTLLLSPVLFWLRPLLVGMGQDPVLAGLAQDYMRGALWGLLPILAAVVLRTYLTTLGRPRAVLAISLAAIVLNAGLNYLLIFGALGIEGLGAFGAGLGSAITNTVMALALILHVAFRPPYRRHALFGRFWRPDWSTFRRIHRLGLPIGLSIVVEVSLFSGSAQLMGWIGTLELAAHQIALQLASITFMAPLGIGQAATARVGLAWGRGDKAGARQAGLAGMVLGFGFMACTAVLFAALPRTLANPFLGDGPEAAPVLAFAATYITIAAAFQLFDGLQVTAISALRGLQDMTVPLLIAIVGYWLVGLGFGTTLAFAFDWGGRGIWTGMALGLAFMAVVLVHRFLRLTRLEGG